MKISAKVLVAVSPFTLGAWALSIIWVNQVAFDHGADAMLCVAVLTQVGEPPAGVAKVLKTLPPCIRADRYRHTLLWSLRDQNPNREIK